jgi:hypothetical protein
MILNVHKGHRKLYASPFWDDDTVSGVEGHFGFHKYVQVPVCVCVCVGGGENYAAHIFGFKNENEVAWLSWDVIFSSKMLWIVFKLISLFSY